MGKNLYVGNLVFAATDEMLRRLFEQFGPVESSEIKFDRASGRSRGFGFVMMANEADAEQAVAALHGQPFMDCQLVVSEARPRQDSGGMGLRRDPR
jgi:RNA recognition motif-containing protein